MHACLPPTALLHRHPATAVRVQVRIALEVHAAQLGTSLLDLVRNVGTHPDTFRSATFSGSQRFTPSRHASLLRVAAGGSQGPTSAAAAAVAAAGSEPGSPASAVSDEVVPVAMLEPEVDGGDAPSMRIEVWVCPPGAWC